MKLLPFLIIFWASTSFAYPPSAPQSAGSGDLLSSNNLSDVDNAAAALGNILTNSAGLAAATSDETGTGANVHANTPTLVTPVIGAATGTSLDLSGALSAASISIDASATPKATLDDSDGADGYWDVNATDADDAVATLGVDDSVGDDQPYIEMDGVNERIELKKEIAGTTVDISTTGVIKGRASYGADITGAVSHDTTATHGVFYHFTAAATVTLDAAADAGYGAQACYRVRDAAEAAVIDIQAGEKINLSGTALAAGTAITATGAGESVCMIATTDTDASGTDGWEAWGPTSGWASE